MLADPEISRLVARKLPANSASSKIGGMRVGKETLGVLYNLGDVEAIGLVFTGRWVGYVDEEGALQASDRVTAVVGTSGVREGLETISKFSLLPGT